MKKIFTLILCFGAYFSNAQSYSECQLKKTYNESESIINQQPENFVLDDRYWKNRIITYYFVNGTSDIPGVEEYQIVRDAFNVWQSNSNLLFIESCDNNTADISISWLVGEHGDGLAYNTNVGHAFFPPPNMGALAGDIHFNDGSQWTTYEDNSGQTVNLRKWAIHEIGHSLGLRHSNIGFSVMYENNLSNYSNLYQDDINAIQSIYGAPKSDFWNFTGPNQFCPNATYSIDIPNNLPLPLKIKWSVTGPALISGADSLNTVTVNATGSGTAELKAAITYGCETRILTKTITSSYTPILTGPDKFCTTANYQVNGLPTNAIVTWTTSGAVQIVGSNTANPVTVSKLSDGAATLCANITSACTNKTINKNITVGLPLPTLTAVNLSPWGSYNDFAFTANPYNAEFTYNWYVNGVLKQSMLDNNFDWYTPCGTSANISCKIINSCGTSLASKSFFMTGNCDKWQYSLVETYPNPADNELRIKYNELKFIQENVFVPIDLKLINADSRIICSGQIQDEKSTVIWDTGKIPNGTYYLHIQQGENLIKKQVIINHQ